MAESSAQSEEGQVQSRELAKEFRIESVSGVICNMPMPIDISG